MNTACVRTLWLHERELLPQHWSHNIPILSRLHICTVTLNVSRVYQRFNLALLHISKMLLDWKCIVKIDVTFLERLSNKIFHFNHIC